MAIRVQILPKKTFDDGSVRSVSGLSVFPPPWWSSNEHQFAHSTLPRDHISLKLETPSRLYHRAKHFDLQQPDREPTSVQSIGETHREVRLETAADSLCNALQSGPDKSRESDIERQAKPVFLVNNPNTLFGPSHQNYYHSMDCARYPYADAYFSGLFTPYGPQVLAQLGGGAPTRIPLPLDLAEDEPVYVNAKQYHGILRRRKCRAKLEAQNKLVKTRKPYLHESRHIHALRRVRGSGGRFLSKKKLQQSDANCTNRMNSQSELESHRSGAAEYTGSSTNCWDISSVSINDGNSQLQGHRYSDMSSHTRNGIRHGTSAAQ